VQILKKSELFEQLYYQGRDFRRTKYIIQVSNIQQNSNHAKTAQNCHLKTTNKHRAKLFCRD
jgi:hypothetical protein